MFKLIRKPDGRLYRFETHEVPGKLSCTGCMGRTDFSDQFRKIIIRFKRIC